ncbi:unnamed protein product [Prunus armeniaca]
MEDHHSMNSMMRKSLSSGNTRATSHESPEESSWTMYLEDFLTSNNDDGDDGERSSFSSYGYENSSIISDAASAVTRKLSAINGEVLGFDNRSSFEFDRRKTKEDLLDDALEDTASSPVNSPKVFNLNQSDVRPTQQNNNTDISYTVKQQLIFTILFFFHCLLLSSSSFFGWKQWVINFLVGDIST